MAVRTVFWCLTAMVLNAAVEGNERKLALANNNFAMKMYSQIAGTSTENIFISPFSLSSAFGMLYYGAKGQTAEELRNVLGYSTAGLSDNEVHSSFQRFQRQLSSSQDYTLNSANSVLIDESLELVSNYKEEVANLYEALVQSVNFARDAPQMVSQINNWVSSKTNGKIRNLISQLSPSNVLVLLNAVYFKGLWDTPFNSQFTFADSFFNYGDQTQDKKVQVMHTKGKFPHAEMEDFDAIELPYKGDNISMLILLPKEMNGLPNLESTLTPENIIYIKSQMQTRPARVSLPKFKVEFSKELSGAMHRLGAGSIFSPGADFGGLTSSRNLMVSEVLHKAVLEVNEEGSEAAAATAIFIARTSLVKTVLFNVDRPFLFAIIDKRSDMILFMGRITNL